MTLKIVKLGGQTCVESGKPVKIRVKTTKICEPPTFAAVIQLLVAAALTATTAIVCGRFDPAGVVEVLG